MMLPSGNDAAQSLGIFFGNLANQIEKAGGTAQNIDHLDGNICEESYQEDVDQARQELLDRKQQLLNDLSIQQQD